MLTSFLLPYSPESAIKSGVNVPSFNLWPDLRGPNVQELRYDLEVRGAAKLAWDPKVIQLGLSDRIFSILRSAFQSGVNGAGPDLELATLLGISPTTEGRYGAANTKWPVMDNKNNPSLQLLQSWAKPVEDQFKAAWIKVQGIDSATPEDLDAQIRFYYTPPGVGAYPPRRGFHTGEESFIFLAQDQVVSSSFAFTLGATFYYGVSPRVRKATCYFVACMTSKLASSCFWSDFILSYQPQTKRLEGV